METCIIVPSHINNINRTKLFICCIQSLINQTEPIPIYLSVSFETELDKTLFDRLVKKINLFDDTIIHIIFREKKTSQFRHIEKVIDIIKDNYKYVMFCDDDDTYENDRVKSFINMIKCGHNSCPEDKIFVGVYEMTNSESHSTRFYEYWSYCINVNFIINFINIIKINNYDYVIDNKFCDVLFSTYLRHLDNKHLFVSIDEKLYNYNRNVYSITIKTLKQNEINHKKAKINERNFETFIRGLNEHIEENINDVKDNILLLCSTKMSFENILKKLLEENYEFKNNINNTIEKIKNEYDDIKYLCDILYQYK
jgi:hypothetical protein